MKINLKRWDGGNTPSLLGKIDFDNFNSPLSIDLSEVDFFRPPSLSILYSLFKAHAQAFPSQERTCVPPKDLDTYRYIERVDFFDCCEELKEFKREDFSRHSSSGRFVPIKSILSEQDTDPAAQEIIDIIYSVGSSEGTANAKYVLTEIMDNALIHSESKIGCVVQAQLYQNKYVTGVIVDCGIGIKKHLSRNRELSPDLDTDMFALRKALEPRVTGTKNNVPVRNDRKENSYHTHAGLGLSVCNELAKRSGGSLSLVSQDAYLKSDFSGVVQGPLARRWDGTIVVFMVNCEKVEDYKKIVQEFDLGRTTRDNLLKFK